MSGAIMVFSHPNHEIAVLGTIDRLRPNIVFLTDGGGRERVEQSRKGLSRYLDSEKMHWLDRRERSLYDALLAHDYAFYGLLVTDLARVLREIEPDVVYCDAVEFYNPIHDMALPIVRAALAGRRDAPVYEVPLIHQELGRSDPFVLQRAPLSIGREPVWIDLDEDELDRKVTLIRSGCYEALSSQLGDRILRAIPTLAKREQVLPARMDLPEPAPGQVLRYDERGRKLKASGEVREAITYREHYLPMFKALLTGAT